MAQELLYTSAPRGLKSGSRGFCTVEATAGMSPALVTVLEGLSGYRHVAAPGDPANPVVYSHVTLSVGGRRCSVVSRVADAGADYTGRTNKLAHHLALDAAERPKGGPAWLAGQPNVLRNRFDGEPRTLPPRTVSQGDRPPAVCKAWQAATGDAGWAGVLAEAFLADPKRPVYLVVPAGLDVMPLFEEAIALLPPDRRWEPTFTTCYTSLPQNVTCQWKAVLAGSKEAHESRRFVQALRIDLTQPLGPATGGSLVEAARTGRMPAVAVPTAPRQTPVAAAIARPNGSATALDDAPLDVMPAAPQRRPDQFLIEPLERPPALQRRLRWKAVMWTGAAVLCLAVIALPVVLGVMHFSPDATTAETQAVATREDNISSDAIQVSPAREIPPEPVLTVRGDAQEPATQISQSPVLASGDSTATIESLHPPGPSANDNDDLTPNLKAPEADATLPKESTTNANTSTSVIEHVTLDKAGRTGNAFVAKAISIPKEWLKDTTIDIWLPTSTASHYSVKARHTRIITVDSEAYRTKACTIEFKESSNPNTLQLSVEGRARDVKQLFSQCVAVITYAPADKAPELRQYRFSIGGSEDAAFPGGLHDGVVTWEADTIPGALFDNLVLKQITIEWMDSPYRFELRGSDGNSAVQKLTSVDIDNRINKMLGAGDLRESILADPPYIELRRATQQWTLQAKPGHLWTAFKKSVGVSLATRSHELSAALGDRGEIDGRSGAVFFSYDGLFEEGAKEKAITIGQRFEEVIADTERRQANLKKELASANSSMEKERLQADYDAAAMKAKTLQSLHSVYDQHQTAARLASEGRDEFWNAKVIGLEIVYFVENGDKLIEVPFLTSGK